MFSVQQFSKWRSHRAGTAWQARKQEPWLLYLDSVFLHPRPLHTSPRLLLLLLLLRLLFFFVFWTHFDHTSFPLVLVDGQRQEGSRDVRTRWLAAKSGSFFRVGVGWTDDVVLSTQRSTGELWDSGVQLAGKLQRGASSELDKHCSKYRCWTSSRYQSFILGVLGNYYGVGWFFSFQQMLE